MKNCTRNLLSLVLVACLILSLFSSVMAAPSATLIVTTPSGYDSASDVVYQTYGDYIANWGARGEDCGFLSTYAQSFYTGSYKYSTLSKVSGGTSTSNAPSSPLYSSLQKLMADNHTYFTKYGDSDSSRDCKDLYQYTDCMLGDPTYVSTLYRGYKVGGAWDSGVSYNQEHVWPNSKCIGTNSTDVGDIMHLRPANSSENSSRGNTAYGEGSSYYDPGISVRGDCARTVLYMYVRWGNTGNMWGTDGVMESLDILLKWIKEDPVDTWEMGHNDAVQSITGTRNVFVDYPEYAYLLFGRSIPSDLTTPATGGDPNANHGSGGSGDSGSTQTGIATLVTNASSLKAGDQVIIASADYEFAMSTTQNTNNRVQAAVTKNGNTLTYGADVQVFTLETGTVSGTFGFRTEAGQYIYAPSSASNHLKSKSTLDDNASWAVSINGTTGVAAVTAKGSSTRNVMRYNYSSALFSCYGPGNTQLDVAIYRLGTDGGGSGDSGDSGNTDTGSSTASMVTRTSSLKVGDRIIIAALDYDFALSTTQTGNNRAKAAVTKNGNTLTAGSDVQIITLEAGTTSGTFAFCVGPEAYLYAPSSTANYLRTTDSIGDNGSWTVSIDSTTGSASVTAGAVTRNVLRYNATSSLFSCYAANNTQKDIAIYKLSSTTQCSHSYTSKVTIAATCTASGVRTYTCSKCGNSYTETIAAKGHSYRSQVTAPTCTAQGYTTYTCSSCGNSYKDNYTVATGHSYSGSYCTACGAANPNYVASYYLVGYINGADYGCEGDWENMGSYKFVNGRLVTTFTQDSYVFLKTEGNANWYMTQAYCTDTTATFYNTNTGTSEKMFVPGNVEITFTLTENANGSLTLSYTTAGPSASAVPTLKLKAPTLEFKDMICVVAFYTAENLDNVVEMGMITYSSKADVVSVETAEHVIPGATYEAGSGRYFSSSQGIHAKYLGDTVYLAIYAKLKDGTYAYSSQASYSPVQYATSQLKGTDVKLKQLVAAMLNYGAEAQLYFGHNTSALANSTLTADQKALPAAYNSNMGGSVPSASASKQGAFASNKGFSSRRPAVSFEGAFSINYFFTPAYAPDNGITLYYWSEADYNAASVLTASNATGSVKMVGSGIGEYRGDVTGIAAKALSEAVYVAGVYTSNGTTWTSGVLGYSIGAYCSSQASKGDAVAALAMATAVYGYHAKQYFG